MNSMLPTLRFLRQWSVCFVVALFFGLNGIMAGDGAAMASDEGEEEAMQIVIRGNGHAITFELNGSQAAGDLYAQLPLRLDVENYSRNEKIFYPPSKLRTGDTPLVKAARPGTLAYYAPWGDVVMFYGAFGSAAGLYELGHALQGEGDISSLAGSISIEAIAP